MKLFSKLVLIAARQKYINKKVSSNPTYFFTGLIYPGGAWRRAVVADPFVNRTRHVEQVIRLNNQLIYKDNWQWEMEYK